MRNGAGTSPGILRRLMRTGAGCRVENDRGKGSGERGQT